MKSVFLLSIITFAATLAFGVGGSGTVGPGNPAAITCQQVGGKDLVIEDQNGNQSSLCAVGQAMIETWTLYREVKIQEQQQAIQVFLSHPEAKQFGSAHQAKEYCKYVGGQSEDAKALLTNQMINLCNFPDGSQIEAITLWRGPQAESNQNFVTLLNK